MLLTHLLIAMDNEIFIYLNKVLKNFLFFFLLQDPFADAAKGDESGVQDGLVHIRIQQRNGRKTLTTIQGLSTEYDLKKIVRACKKVCWKMNSSITLRQICH